MGKHPHPPGGPNGLYDDLDKHQLVELVLSYDEKLKALSSEVSELQKKLKAADEATREIEAASAASKSSVEKDKYKQLARRLKVKSVFSQMIVVTRFLHLKPCFSIYKFLKDISSTCVMSIQI